VEAFQTAYEAAVSPERSSIDAPENNNAPETAETQPATAPVSGPDTGLLGAIITAIGTIAADLGLEGAEEEEILEDVTVETGTGEISGLPVGENGRFYFALDGSGAPLQIRIDIPLAQYQNLSFDGSSWVRGLDYSVRSGSTILTVTAERLENYNTGLHTLRAYFQEQTVEIPFDLIKTAPPLSAQTNTVPIALITALALALAALVSAVVIVKTRGKGAVN
jgi:hypothetical protein